MDVKILTAIVALDGVTFAMTRSAWVPFLAGMGASNFFIAIIASVPALITLLWAPIIGSLSDMHGRKKCLFYMVLAIIAGTSLLLTHSLPLVFLSQVICAFGSQLQAQLKAFTDDNVPSSEEKAKVFSRMGAAAGMTFIAGPLLGAALNMTSYGTYAVFLFVLGIHTVNFILVNLLKNDKGKVEKKAADLSVTANIRSIIQNLQNVNWPKYWDIFLIKLISDLSLNFFFFNNGIILSKNFGLKGSGFGLFMASLGIVGVASHLFIVKLVKTYYADDVTGFKRLLHGNMILCFAFVTASYAPTLPIFMLCMIPMPISRVLFESTTTEVVLARVTDQDKGTVLGAFESTLPFGSLVVPLVSGVVTTFYSANFAMLLGSLPLMVACGLCYYNDLKAAKVKTK